MKLEIRQLFEEDWESIAKIYKEGIQTGNATFEQDVPAFEVWDMGHLKNCRIVAISDNQIVGWAALSLVSGRCVYTGVAEVSVYVGNSFQGKGIGSTLLEKLIMESEKEKLWTLQAGIFPENIPSINLHEQRGFRKVGYREKIGILNGLWRDTLLFERRSKNIGID